MIRISHILRARLLTLEGASDRSSPGLAAAPRFRAATETHSRCKPDRRCVSSPVWPWRFVSRLRAPSLVPASLCRRFRMQAKVTLELSRRVEGGLARTTFGSGWTGSKLLRDCVWCPSSRQRVRKG